MSKTIKIDNAGNIVSGSSYCFVSRDAAIKASAEASTSPGAVAYYDPAMRRDLYLGAGDTFVRGDGSRGRWVYGRGRQLVEVDSAA